MEVTILDTTSVFPSKPPFENDHVLPLSHLDNDRNLQVNFRYVRAYVSTPTANDPADPLQVISAALSRALVYYYPFTGTLRRRSVDGRLELFCAAGKGVPLISASAPCSLDSVNYLDDPDPLFVERLVPDPKPDEELINPCVLQVTVFSCGGYTLGASIQHSLCDGLGATQFFNAMAEIARGATRPSIEPVWDRAGLLGPRNPPRVDVPFEEFLCLDNGFSPYTHETGQLLRECFQVRDEMLDRFKTLLFEQSGLRFTTFEALGAYIWRARVKACRIPGEEKVKFAYSINIRKLVKPALPVGYWGNGCVAMYVQLSVKELMEQPKDEDMLYEKDMPSEEIWTPDEAVSSSERSDFSKCTEENKVTSHEGTHQPFRGTKQFNMSYHKTNVRSKDGTNGTTHIAQLRAVSGFTRIIDKATSLQSNESNTPAPSKNDVTHTVDVSEVRLAEKLSRKDASQFPNGGADSQIFEDDDFQNGCGQNGSYSNDTSFDAGELGLKADQSKVPRPSNLVPKSANGSSAPKGALASKFKASKSDPSEVAAGDCSPSYFDEEIDPNSDAAAAVAIVKKAIEEAQTKIRIAKESMSFKDGLEVKKREIKVANETNGFKENKAQEIREIEKTAFEYFCGKEEENVTRMGQVALDSKNLEKHFVAKEAAGETSGKKYELNPVNNGHERGEWEEAKLSNDNYRETTVVFEQADDNKKKMPSIDDVWAKLKTSMETFEFPWIYGKKPKPVEEPFEQEEFEKKVNAVNGEQECEENANKSNSAEDIHEKENQQEIGLKDSHEREESEKGLEEDCEGERYENVEWARKQEEAYQMDEIETKEKDVNEWEEIERMQTEFLETQENEKKITATQQILPCDEENHQASCVACKQGESDNLSRTQEASTLAENDNDAQVTQEVVVHKGNGKIVEGTEGNGKIVVHKGNGKIVEGTEASREPNENGEELEAVKVANELEEKLVFKTACWAQVVLGSKNTESEMEDESDVFLSEDSDENEPDESIKLVDELEENEMFKTASLAKDALKFNESENNTKNEQGEKDVLKTSCWAEGELVHDKTENSVEDESDTFLSGDDVLVEDESDVFYSEDTGVNEPEEHEKELKTAKLVNELEENEAFKTSCLAEDAFECNDEIENNMKDESGEKEMFETTCWAEGVLEHEEIVRDKSDAFFSEYDGDMEEECDAILSEDNGVNEPKENDIFKSTCLAKDAVEHNETENNMTDEPEEEEIFKTTCWDEGILEHDDIGNSVGDESDSFLSENDGEMEEEYDAVLFEDNGMNEPKENEKESRTAKLVTELEENEMFKNACLAKDALEKNMKDEVEDKEMFGTTSQAQGANMIENNIKRESDAFLFKNYGVSQLRENEKESIVFNLMNELEKNKMFKAAFLAKDTPEQVDQNKRDSGCSVEEKLAPKLMGNDKNVEETEVAVDETEENNISEEAHGGVDNVKIMEAGQLKQKGEAFVIAEETKTSQRSEETEENLNRNLTMEEKEAVQKEVELEKEHWRTIDETKKKEREREEKIKVERAMEEKEAVQKEVELEKEHWRTIDETQKKEREREEKIKVERAMREARERKFAEVRERASMERATSETQQRVKNDVRVKEAKELKEQRMYVERAAAEARERAAAEARERYREKIVSRKISFSGSSGDNEMKSSVVSSDQGSRPSSSLNYTESSADGAKSENDQRRKDLRERQEKAVAEKNRRDLLAQKEQAERNRLAEALDGDIKRWSSGKTGNLRLLLSTLHNILGPDSGWQQIPLADIVASDAVKKAYRKATLFVHPDKLQQRSASIKQKYICEKVFDLLKEARDRFSSE